MMSCKLVFLCGCFAAILLHTTANDVSNHIGDDKPQLHVFEGVMQFKLNKNDFDTNNGKDCVTTPEFEMHHVTWKIKACKKGYSEEFLMVTLIAVFEGKTSAWSCDAEAIFKVLPNGSYNPAYARFAYFAFDSAHTEPNLKQLVEWKKLVSRHMVGDVATIDITIKVKPPNRVYELQHTSTKFQMRIPEVDTLSVLYSEEAIVLGIRWKVLAWKKDDYLYVGVFANDDDMVIDYTWAVDATFDLIKWSDFIDPSKKFLAKNSALLQVQLKVGKPKPKVNS